MNYEPDALLTEGFLGTLHQGFSYEKYASIPGLRNSDLKRMMRSPAHYKASLQEEQEDTEALMFGSLFHLALENKEKFLSTYVVEPTFEGLTKDGKMSTRSGEAKLKKQEWYANLKSDAVVVKKEWVEPLVGMLNACAKHTHVGQLLKNGVRETSLWVKDPETGLTLKCRPDFISTTGRMVDIKTTRDARPWFFLDKQTFSDRDYFYALQAAHYSYCARLTKVCRGDHFTFVAVEKEPPYGIMIYTLDEHGIEVGERHRKSLTAKFKECSEKNDWPCYQEKPYHALPPDWAMRNDDY